MKYDLWQNEREKAKVLDNGLKILLDDKLPEKPILKVWKPKATKPFVHYYFKSNELRQEYLQKVITNFNSHQTYKKEQREKQRTPNPEMIKELKRGDIFVTSWGYDQTNYDYIAVLEVSKTGKTCKCQRTGALHMGESGQANVQEPIFSTFGDIFNLQVRTGYSGGISLVGSYPFLHTGEGSKRRGYFSKHTIGQQYHETMAQFGH